MAGAGCYGEGCAAVIIDATAIYAGSVGYNFGRPCPGIDVRIAEDGEVQIRSSGVFAENSSTLLSITQSNQSSLPNSQPCRLL